MNHKQFSPDHIIRKAEQNVTILKSKSQQSRIKKILHMLLSIEIDIRELKELARKGLPHQLNGVRILCWLVCLGVLTNRPAAWPAILRQRRHQYQQYEKELIGPIQSLEQLNEKQRSLLTTIQKDTLRTQSRCSFFHTTTSSSLPHSRSVNRLNHINSALGLSNKQHSLDLNTFVFDHLSYILLIYTNIYSSCRYSQSMSGLIAPIFFAVNQNSQQINHYITFALFRQIHKPLQNFMIKELDSTQVGIFKFLQNLELSLMEIAPKLACKLRDLDVTSHYYALGWTLTIFSQNFDLYKLLYLWDSLISSNILIKDLQQTCMAVLQMRKETIMKGNLGEIMQKFKNLNDLDLDDLVEERANIRKKLDRLTKKQSPLKAIVHLFSDFDIF